MIPSLSIWISTRNAAPFIARCIESLRSQSLRDWDAVFIDDVSTDATWERALVAIDDDARIVPIRNAERVRQVGAFFQALPRMRGDVLVELDGDDHFCSIDALSEITACYAADDTVDATSGRNRSSLGIESPPWTGHRTSRWQNLSASMCAPRSWKRSLTERALVEMPEVFRDGEDKYWQSAGDLALFAPVLHYARRIASTVRPVYEINMVNPESDWIKESAVQQRCSDTLVEIWRKLRLTITAQTTDAA